MMNINNIYLAAHYARNPEMRGYRDELVLLGYTVTSHWIDQHDGHLDEALGAEELTESPGLGTPYALQDLTDIHLADAVINFTGAGRGGRHVEFGMAYILGKFLIVIGQREHVFHTLPGVDYYPDWSQFITSLKKFS